MDIYFVNMKDVLVKCMIFLFIFCTTIGNERRRRSDIEWKKYLDQFQKEYEEEEEAMRRKCWEESMKRIKSHNEEYHKGGQYFLIGLNHMSDWTEEERKAHRSCGSNKLDGDTDNKEEHIDKKLDVAIKDEFDMKCGRRCQSKLPKNVDWREANIITDVKSQHKCGSCYAFGTVAAIESHYALAHGVTFSLSVQEVVDCANSKKYDSGRGPNGGCKEGGYAPNVLKYVMEQKGLSAFVNYPYTAKDGKCKKKEAGGRFGEVASYKKLKSNDENNLRAVVAHYGPVAASIFATKKLHDYHHGFINDSECKHVNDTNHLILIVGYGVANNTPYWLIKNSWGTDWGLDGYGMIPRDGTNHCGIASRLYLPIPKK